jgi:MbtH protein
MKERSSRLGHSYSTEPGALTAIRKHINDHRQENNQGDSTGKFKRPQMEELKMNEQQDSTIYKVVLNHEEQYSIWPAHRENPLGWRDAAKTGTKEECLEYIKEIWTDMRPLSLRKKMEALHQS